MTDLKVPPVPEKGNWNKQKTKLIAKFPTLTEADLRYEDGKKEEMMKKVQTKLGKTKEEFATIINSL
ncbi:MAG: general stress protein CsbD [Bacteroidetes bacterium]|nr:general stress protein CsbD [Bacteroidota bacterium]